MVVENWTVMRNKMLRSLIDFPLTETSRARVCVYGEGEIYMWWGELYVLGLFSNSKHKIIVKNCVLMRNPMISDFS